MLFSLSHFIRLCLHPLISPAIFCWDFSINVFLGEVAGLTQNPQPGGPGFVSGLLPYKGCLHHCFGLLSSPPVTLGMGTLQGTTFRARKTCSSLWQGRYSLWLDCLAWEFLPVTGLQPGRPGCPFLSGPSPLTCLVWETLPVAKLPPA